MNRNTLVIVWIIALLAGPSWGQEPRLLRERSFTCAIFAEAVNHYVALGEEKTVQEFEKLCEDKGARQQHDFSMNKRLGWLCRALFASKDKTALRPPRFGALNLPMDLTMRSKAAPYKEWPLYPVALSGSTYFILAEGYYLGGVDEPLTNYLAYCRTKGIFRKKAVVVSKREEALHDSLRLRHSAAWQALKWQMTAPEVRIILNEESAWKFIQNQAESVPLGEGKASKRSICSLTCYQKADRQLLR